MSTFDKSKRNETPPPFWLQTIGSADRLASVTFGILGTLSFGLSLRDASLVIVFVNLVCTAAPAFLATLGPRTGMRQMIQARFSFGLVNRLFNKVLP